MAKCVSAYRRALSYKALYCSSFIFLAIPKVFFCFYAKPVSSSHYRCGQSLCLSFFADHVANCLDLSFYPLAIGEHLDRCFVQWFFILHDLILSDSMVFARIIFSNPKLLERSTLRLQSSEPILSGRGSRRVPRCIRIR